MIIEELLNCSADKLESYTDAQLLDAFEKEGVLNLTRPDRAGKNPQASKVNNAQPSKKQLRRDNLLDMFSKASPEKLALLKEEGINISELL